MTFDELPLYEAVHLAKPDTKGLASDPFTHQERVDVARVLQNYMVPPCPFSIDQMVTAWVSYRKSGTKIPLKVEVAQAHGSKCFYANRGMGDCSDDVDLDRIVPGSRGGEYSIDNCVIACGHHNRMRGNKAIEEFLNTDQVAC